MKFHFMLIVLKKILAFFVLMFSVTSFSQNRNDLGYLYSTDYNTTNTLEFRHLMDNGYHFKFGGFLGNDMDYSYRESIISSTDTSVTFENYYKNTSNYGVKIGLEKQMSTSIFSVGGDLNLTYRSVTQEFSYRTTYLTLDSIYLFEPFDVNNVLFQNSSYIIQQFLVPSLRLSFMMNVPLGDAFLINFNISSSLGVPIYMGAKTVVDSKNKFATPGTIFDLNTGFGLGLRYILGSTPIVLKKDKK